MKNFLLIHFLLFLVGNTSLFSQNNLKQIKFNSIKEGIPKRGVFTILEDQEGFMWFGTDGAGLFRYDGSSYKAYSYVKNDSTSINGNLVFTVFLDSKNRMWVGTNRGLNLYHQKTGTFTRIKLITEKSESCYEFSVRCIFEDDDGNILLGTEAKGLLKLNPDTYQITSFPIQQYSKDQLIISGLIEHMDELWLISNMGLLVFDKNKKLVRLAQIPTQDGVYSITEPLESICVDEENGLWVGTANNGVIQLVLTNDIYQVNKFPFTKKRILSLISIEENRILCGTENDGLFFFEKKKNGSNQYELQEISKNSVNSNSIWTLYKGSQDRIWLGSYNRGVSVYDKLYNKFDNIKNLPNNNSLQGRSVSSVKEDESGIIWIAMDGGGIDIYNPKTKKLQHINSVDTSEYSGLTNDDVVSLFFDKKGNLWVGTWGGGVYFLEKGKKEFKNYVIENTNLVTNRILKFAEDSKGRIWMTTFDKGLIYFDPKTNNFNHCNFGDFKTHQLLNKHIGTVEVDRDGNIWLGSMNGLFRVSENSKDQFSVISYNEELLAESQFHPSTTNVHCIFQKKNGDMLFGTDGAGLFILPSGNSSKIKQIKTDGFHEESVSSIVETENGTIWISGKGGIKNLDLKTKKTTSYNQDDGLLCNNFFSNSVHYAKDGTLYYGSTLGLNFFKPEEIIFNQIEPVLHLTNFKIYNKEVDFRQKDSPLSKLITKTKKITLDHSQRVFTIGYVGINFTRSEKNQYAFQLKGVDPDWRYVGNEQKATYTNLHAGDYIFQVKSANNDGRWNETPLELKIEILPPWWKSNWAYAFYTMVFFLSVFLLQKLLNHRIYVKHAVQVEREKRLQEEKLSQQKLEFFTNISHEFRTPLTLILNPLEDIIKNESLQFPEEVKRKHQIIYKNSDRLNRLINELMDFRKLQFHKMVVQAEQVEVVKYVQETLSYFNEEAENRNIQLTYIPHVENLVAWLDLSMLEKIIFNLVSNAFKVTPNNGKITVTIQEKNILFPSLDVKKEKEGFEIIIQDTGAGLTKTEVNEIFRRFNQVNKLKNNYYGGTGIGLEVVQDFMKLHKGNIQVNSKVGKGSSFIISFLLGSSHFSKEEILQQKHATQFFRKPMPTVAPQPVVMEKHPQNEISKEHTLLIVEDNIDLQNYLRMELENLYNILVAENGEVALDLAKKETPHLVLTDVMMPQMNGLELCEKLKADLKTSHIPILVLTAKAMSSDKLKSINSGADAYLSKPLDMELLKSTLNQLLTSRQILFNKYSKNFELDDNAPQKATTLDNVFIKKMVAYIFENIDRSDLSVESIAEHFFLSRSQLYRKTKSLTGVSVNELIRKVRLEEAKKMIKMGDGNISEISFKVGFSSPSYFAKCFKEAFGVLPTEINE